jgi:hypothetical protein
LKKNIIPKSALIKSSVKNSKVKSKVAKAVVKPAKVITKSKLDAPVSKKKSLQKTGSKELTTIAITTASTATKPASLAASTSISNIAVPVFKKHTLHIEVTPDKYFVLCDGRKIKSGRELADLLQLITDDMFRYHVTDTKNDFSNWINDVFGESELAKRIKNIRNRLDMSIELYRHMFDKLDALNKK